MCSVVPLLVFISSGVLVVFHSYLVFFYELNVITYTILWNFNCNWDFLILCNCKLLKILRIKLHKSIYLFRVKPLWSHCGHLKSFSDLYKQTQALLLSPVVFVSGLQWGRGGSRPRKTCESNFIHHDFVHFGKQHSRWKSILSSIVLPHQCCVACFIPLTVAKPLWDLITNYYWNRPPLTSLAGFDPAVRDVRSCGCKTARKCCEVAVTNVCGFAMFTLDWWTGPSLESL